MNNEPDFARLLRNSLVATLCGATLILLSYFLVDRQVAFFVHRHQLSDSAILKFLTYPPPILQAWAPVALAGLMVRRVLGPFHRWECAMIAACLGIIVADQFRDTLGFAFGRYWPETWIDDNPFVDWRRCLRLPSVPWRGCLQELSVGTRCSDSGSCDHRLDRLSPMAMGLCA